MTWVAVGVGGAALVSGVAGQASSAPGRAPRQNRDMFYQTQEAPTNMLEQSLYGQNADLAGVARHLGPAWRQSQDLDQLIAQLAPGRTRADFENFMQQNPGFETAQRGAVDAYGNDMGQALGDFNNRTRGIAGQFGQAAGQVGNVYKGYGSGMENAIRLDESQANASAAKVAAAKAARMGGSNTNDQMLLAGQQETNRQGANKNIADIRQRAAELTGGAMERGLAARNQLLAGNSMFAASMQNQNASNLYGARTGFNNTVNSGRNNIASSQMMNFAPSYQPQGENQIVGNLSGTAGTLLGNWYQDQRAARTAAASNPSAGGLGSAAWAQGNNGM